MNEPVCPMQLSDCPAKPNCVCTTASRSSQEMPPLYFSGSAEEAIQEVAELLCLWPRVSIEVRSGSYLKATVRTRWLRFIDDVEFLADTAGRLDFRSASRLGYSDLGANRRRMEAMAQALSGSGDFTLQPTS